MQSLDFEAALKRLEEINKKLSQPETGLDEGIALYVEGAKLAKECKNALELARKKIDEVNNND